MKKILMGIVLMIWALGAIACPTCGGKKKKQQQLQFQDTEVDTATFVAVEEEPWPVKKWRNKGKKTSKKPVIYTAEFQDEE